jgi:hypothetical protein
MPKGRPKQKPWSCLFALIRDWYKRSLVHEKLNTTATARTKWRKKEKRKTGSTAINKNSHKKLIFLAETPFFTTIWNTKLNNDDVMKN